MIVEQIFPLVFAKKANKILKQKIMNEEDQDYNYGNLPINCISERYEMGIQFKVLIDKKAKWLSCLTFAAFSVASFVWILLYKSVSGMNTFSQWMSVLFLVIGLLYFGCSEGASLRVLFDENEIWLCNLLSFADVDELKRMYESCIKANTNKNLIRNNILYASQICFRNAMICHLMFMVLVFVPTLF